MDGGIDTDHVIENLDWKDLDVDQYDHVTVHEVGRWLRQQNVDVSDFLLLRILSEDNVPSHVMDYDAFVDLKRKLTDELNRKASESETTDPQEEQRRRKAYYLYQWKEYTGSKSHDGELPLSEIENVIFCECNPTKELLDAIKAIKNEGSRKSFNFDEFCDLLENLPKSGMIDEDKLLHAFQTEDVDRSGFVSRAQLYSLLTDNGSDPLKREDVDEIMDDCGVGDMFKYSDTDHVIENLDWKDLDVDQNDHVTVHEVGRWLRQQNVDVSDFLLLRILSEDNVPSHVIDFDTFVDLKRKLTNELNRKARESESRDPQEEQRRRKGSRKSFNFDEFCDLLENLPKSGMIDEDKLLHAFQTEDVDRSGFVSRAQLYSLLTDNGSDPLKREYVDEMMDDCGVGDMFKYSDWIQRVMTIKSLTEK